MLISKNIREIIHATKIYFLNFRRKKKNFSKIDQEIDFEISNLPLITLDEEYPPNTRFVTDKYIIIESREGIRTVKIDGEWVTLYFPHAYFTIYYTKSIQPGRTSFIFSKMSVCFSLNILKDSKGLVFSLPLPNYLGSGRFCLGYVKHHLHPSLEDLTRYIITHFWLSEFGDDSNEINKWEISTKKGITESKKYLQNLYSNHQKKLSYKKSFYLMQDIDSDNCVPSGQIFYRYEKTKNEKPARKPKTSPKPTSRSKSRNGTHRSKKRRYSGR